MQAKRLAIHLTNDQNQTRTYSILRAHVVIGLYLEVPAPLVIKRQTERRLLIGEKLVFGAAFPANYNLEKVKFDFDARLLNCIWIPTICW